MTARLKRVLVALAAGSALGIAPFAYSLIAVPAISSADECSTAGADNEQCGGEARKLSCPDGTIVDDQNNQCVDLLAGISKQLQALPPPPALAGGVGGLGSLPGGIPSLGTVNLPDLVLPSVGLGLVPNLNLNLQPQLGGLPAAPQLPAPQLPSINPLNPLGLPPPPDLTPGIPLI